MNQDMITISTKYSIVSEALSTSQRERLPALLARLALPLPVANYSLLLRLVSGRLGAAGSALCC